MYKFNFFFIFFTNVFIELLNYFSKFNFKNQKKNKIK